MKISVVIPVYNEGKYIKACLNALKRQKIPADETIVVDNNCTDNTIAIAKKYNTNIVKEPKQGMIYARNKGFNTAKYDLIARCDADTVVPSDWIKKIKQTFTENKIDALSGTLFFYDLPIKTTLFANLFIDFMKFIQKGHHILAGPNMALTKKVWNKIKTKVCLDGSKVHEDIDLAIHIHKVGGRIMMNKSLVVATSARRITGNPLSFFVEYPWKLVATLKSNHL